MKKIILFGAIFMLVLLSTSAQVAINRDYTIVEEDNIHIKINADVGDNNVIFNLQSQEWYCKHAGIEDCTREYYLKEYIQHTVDDYTPYNSDLDEMVLIQRLSDRIDELEERVTILERS